MTKKLAMYCVCFPEHEPRKHQKNQIDIMCNASNINQRYREILINKKYVFDDTNENISSLNLYFGDLTASYWIWKNSPFEIVGTCQYRRFWDDKVSNMTIEPNTLYVQEPIKFDTTLKEQYIACHGELGLTVLEKLSRTNKIPLTMDMLEKAYELNYLHACNMYFGYKTVYDKFISLVFDVVFKVYENSLDELKKLDHYNKRLPAFLAERIGTAIIINKDYLLPELNIVPIKWKEKKKSLIDRLIS